MSDKGKDRIYVVEVQGHTPRLVRAQINVQALRHVAHHLIKVRVASQDDLVALVRAGVMCENAADEFSEQRELELPGNGQDSIGVGLGS